MAGRGLALPARLDRLTTGWRRGSKSSPPTDLKKFKSAALEPLSGYNPDSFGVYVKSEVERWAAIVKRSGRA